jgi:hypothetical protein
MPSAAESNSRSTLTTATGVSGVFCFFFALPVHSAAGGCPPLPPVRFGSCRREAVERPARAGALLHMRSGGVARGLHRERVRSGEAADRRGHRSGAETSEASAGRGRADSGAPQSAVALRAVELDVLDPARTMVTVLAPASNGRDSGLLSRWTPFWRRKPRPVIDTDALVAAWKAAWMKGAHARWNAKLSNANPYATGQERSAWQAGWRWAEQHPDRRSYDPSRLAHRLRRADDSTTPLTRALQLTAMGVTVFWVSRALHRWARGPR